MAGEQAAVREAVVRDALHAAVAAVDPPVPVVGKGKPVRPVPRRESPTVPTETGGGSDADGATGMAHAATIDARSVSSPARRQAAALRAGLELLAAVGDAVDATGARLHLTVFASGHRPSLSVDVFGATAPGGPDEAPVILAGLTAVAGRLGLPLTVDYDTPRSVGLSVTTTITGVQVRICTRFTTPDGIAAARALLPASTGDPR
ncbi:hypothetical protein [Frankia sp. CiP1_Cm_nod1]|uniref:hypothetical protein n=1 Tax=Frankia sp. CiP1_Cm_nod1 TaxID=2897160 RepID=UPI00202587B8